jgi:hypothetical protein
MTDDSRYREFFLKPTEIYHRRYEALRAFFVEGRQLEEIAQQFGYQESSLRSMVCRFRAQVETNDLRPFFFNRDLDGLRAELAPAPKSRRRSRRSLTDKRSS